MTRAAPSKLSAEKDFRFWPFHDMFMNHIENMGWITSFVFTELGTYYNIAKAFEQVKIDTIEIDYQALEVATQLTDNIKKLKFRGLYTWLFNSSTNRLKIYLPKKAT